MSRRFTGIALTNCVYCDLPIASIACALQYADLSNTTYPNLSKTVFAIFMVLVPILLLNMLIAMMGNTYAHVIEQSEKEFVKQVGMKIFMI